MRIHPALLLSIAFGMAAPAAVHAHPDAHEIIQKIALEELTPVKSSLPVALMLPKTWKSQAHGDDILTVWAPYHNGVTAHVEKLANPLDFQAAVQSVASHFQTDFKEDSRESFTLDSGLQGDKGILSGRIGSAEYRIFMAVVRLKDGTCVLYYATAPILWYAAYAPLFGDILGSFGLP